MEKVFALKHLLQQVKSQYQLTVDSLCSLRLERDMRFDDSIKKRKMSLRNSRFGGVWVCVKKFSAFPHCLETAFLLRGHCTEEERLLSFLVPRSR